MIILARIILGTVDRVTSLQLLQSLRAPFFGILTITPLHQSSGTFSPSHTAVNSGWRMVAAIPGSALNSSASRLSRPGDFPFLRTLIVSLVGGLVLMARFSVAPGMTAVSSNGGLFISSQKCSVHLFLLFFCCQQ